MADSVEVETEIYSSFLHLSSLAASVLALQAYWYQKSNYNVKFILFNL